MELHGGLHGVPDNGGGGVLHYRALHGDLHGAPWSFMEASMEVETSMELHEPPWRSPWSLHGAP